MAKHLLHDADVYPLLDQQSRRRVPGIMDPGVADLRLAQDSLPRAPVLGTFDRASAPGGEHQIVVRPRAACAQPFRGLPLAMLAQQLQERGRALEREPALPFTLPEDDAAADTVRAFGGVAGAVWRAGTLVADVALFRAARLASRKMPVLLTPRFTCSAMPPFAACARIVASVLPFDALNLEPGADDAGFQVHI